ncbi:MAG: FAD-dependent oxidoreductase [Flavobacteriales bacterium]|nr:FAD-dependent oxidoreductase [Flavobacteriales bacterium]
MPHTHDVIIIGRGIAGVVLSETLHAMGKRVAVFDVPKSNAASPVAAGIVNPVAMRRIIASWRAAEMLDLAEPFYRSLEHEYGEALWHPLPLGRLFANEREAQEWPQRMRDPEVGSFLSEGALPGFDAGKFNAPHGYGVVKRCAWLDVEVMREAHRSKWTAMNALIEREVLPTDVLTTDDGVEVFDCSAPWIVWCNGPFAALPGLVPTRGEVMSLHLPELDIEAMVHRNGFLLPVGNNNYKLGSTFAWSDVWSGPTESGREELVRKLNGLLGHVGSPPLSTGEGSGVRQVSGVRPASRDRRPILGQVAPHQAVFNGLGSRGVLLTPWCAQHLVAHLFDAVPLDAEVNAARFHA